MGNRVVRQQQSVRGPGTCSSNLQKENCRLWWPTSHTLACQLAHCALADSPVLVLPCWFVVACCAVLCLYLRTPPPHNDPSSSQAAAAAGEQEQEEEDVFQPSKGNVAFGSASDGWAFRLDQFADMYSAKLGAKPAALVQVCVCGGGGGGSRGEGGGRS